MPAAAHEKPVPADLEAFALVTRELAGSVEGAGEASWARPTPCTDWTLGDLVDHVTGGNRFTTAILRGADAGTAMASARDSFARRSPRRTEIAESLQEMQQEFGVAGALGRRYHHVAGELSGDEILRLRLHDLIVHAWDMAASPRPSGAHIHPDLVGWSLTDLRRRDGLVSRHLGVSVAPTDDDESAVLRLFGRTLPGNPGPNDDPGEAAPSRA